MRVISFCADGIRNAAERGFFDWAINQDADFICVQDLQAQESDLQADRYYPDGYFAYFLDSPEPNTNGVALYTRKLPKAIMTGLGMEADIEARYIQADFTDLSVACLFAPQATQKDKGSIEAKSAFFRQLGTTLDKVRNKRRRFIVCGNWAIAHRKADLMNPDSQLQTVGFLPEEQQWMDWLFNDLGYVDAFRVINSDEDEFSWWPEGRDAENAWRVDYQIVSGSLRPSIEYGALFKAQEFSSHAPLIMDYDLEIDDS